jgi:hypothetical protein
MPQDYTISKFYGSNGEKPGYGDRTHGSLNQILAKNDQWLEQTHNYIQVLFPIPEPSRNNANTKLLDAYVFISMEININ